MRVVLDTSVWLSGLLAPAGSTSASATLKRAVRDGVFSCVGSMPLILELDEKLRTSAIARRVNLTEQQVRDVRALAFALLDPLVNVSGERIGCEDPDDDHILELAINAKARFIVARDNDILSLPSVARKRLDDSGVTVMRADVFCAFLRELFPLADPAVKPVIVALMGEMTQAWLAKSETDRRAWLNDKLAQSNEYMMWPNGILASNTIEANHLLLFWNVTNQDSAEGLVALLKVTACANSSW